jgi:hypothetical protein
VTTEPDEDAATAIIARALEAWAPRTGLFGTAAPAALQPATATGHFQALLDFLVGPGARYGEAAGLWVQHLHLDADRPYVDIRAAPSCQIRPRTGSRPIDRTHSRK